MGGGGDELDGMPGDDRGKEKKLTGRRGAVNNFLP